MVCCLCDLALLYSYVFEFMLDFRFFVSAARCGPEHNIFDAFIELENLNSLSRFQHF